MIILKYFLSVLLSSLGFLLVFSVLNADLCCIPTTEKFQALGLLTVGLCCSFAGVVISGHYLKEILPG